MLQKEVEQVDWNRNVPDAPGIRVVSPEVVAQDLARCRRRLSELEHRGVLPRRRRIGKRRTGYYQHELESRYADEVVVRDPRTLSREEVAEKLAVACRTVTRMVREGDLPAPENGRWYERELDAWLLQRPTVRPKKTV